MWAQSGLREVTKQIRFKHNHDGPAILCFGAGQIEHEVKILPVGGHILGIKEMFAVSPVGLAAGGYVVPDETRNHAELLAVADVVADTLPFFRGPCSPTIDWATIDVDVANINAAIGVA